MGQSDNSEKCAFTVTWEVRDGEENAIVDIIKRFTPAARQEPGLELFMVNRCTANPLRFLIYELFTDAAAFAVHQETPHFKELILGEALPKLTKRERVQYTPM